jgi:lysyl-tRNA synthetase class 2
MQDTVATKDGVALPLNMQHAIMIKCAPENSDIRELLRTASESGLTAVPFTQEMLETSDDKKVAGITKKLHFDEVRFLGVLLFGEKKVVDMVTERFALHK